MSHKHRLWEIQLSFPIVHGQGLRVAKVFGLFNHHTTDRQVERLFADDFGELRVVARGGQCSTGPV
jgi:hypothetical protein